MTEEVFEASRIDGSHVKNIVVCSSTVEQGHPANAIPGPGCEFESR